MYGSQNKGTPSDRQPKLTPRQRKEIKQEIKNSPATYDYAPRYVYTAPTYEYISYWESSSQSIVLTEKHYHYVITTLANKNGYQFTGRATAEPVEPEKKIVPIET